MSERIVFPDAEAVAVAHMPDLGVSMSTKVPNPRPASFVRVTRTGGSRRDLVTDGAQLTFEAWAATDVEASDLAALARSYVYQLAEDQVGPIRGARDVSAPVSFPDPESGSPRYQFTVVVDLRGSAA